jgi:hypothetical protein
MLNRRGGHCVLVISNNVYVLGGKQGPSKVINNVEMLSVGDDHDQILQSNWIMKMPMKTYR